MLRSYHESNAKKINYTKIEPTMTFAFYVRNYRDYLKFVKYMENGKKLHGENWLFSSQETKPDYLKANLRSDSEEFEDLGMFAKLPSKSMSAADNKFS